MGVGRFFCLGVPFALTFASLVCLLIVITGLHPNKDYFFAKFDTSNLTITASQASSLASRGFETLSLGARDNGVAHLHTEALSSSSGSSSDSTSSSSGIAHLTSEALSGSSSTSGQDITVNAGDLGLADSYTVGLWSYCAQTNTTNGTTQKCSSAKAEFWFDPFSIWNLTDATAEEAINSTALTDALKTYKTASKWTFVTYMIALVATIVEILVGVIAIFSKIGSCITTIVSSISTVALIAASVLATVMWSIVVETFNHELKKYGLSATVSTKMLAVTWLAVAFSLASGFFWMISTCCCGSTDRHYSRPSRRNRGSDSEKLVPMGAGGYQQVNDPAFVSSPYAGQPTVYNPPTHQGYGAQEYGEVTEYGQSSLHHSGAASAKPLRDLDTSYEPYRHNNV